MADLEVASAKGVYRKNGYDQSRVEKIITVITRLKMGCFNFPNSANYGIK
ncbi:MAG: hypothetical protein E6731_10810 [Lachnospiraceae bacterium]|nr:hypothetical protein [Lachnospiraceae bacterium]